MGSVFIGVGMRQTGSRGHCVGLIVCGQLD